MKKILISTILILSFWNSILGQNSTVKIVTTDLDNFWIAYDAITEASDSLERIKLINELYIDKGTDGLKGMISARNYKDYEFVDAILKYPKYWNSIRPNTHNLVAHKEQIEHYFAKLRNIYPALKPTVIYFPIGVFRSSGTYQEDKVLLGAEYLLAQMNSDLSELPAGVKEAIVTSMPYNIPLISVHELIHTQQKRWEDLSIIHASVAEGVAEFISTLIAEAPLSEPVKFGKNNQQKVLDRYMIEIFRNDDVANWMWSENTNELIQRDLGYYIGYEVCERHYTNAIDKQKAIKELIELDYSDDTAFSKILDGTGFLPLTWSEIGIKYESMCPTVKRIGEFENGSDEVSPQLNVITLEFSEPMSNRWRNFSHNEAIQGEKLKIKKVIGWSADKKQLSFEVEALKPNTHYHLVISQITKEDGGNGMVPYTIEFGTGGR